MDKAPSVNPELRYMVVRDTVQVQAEDPTAEGWKSCTTTYGKLDL